jgi:hypothetical protein
MANEKQQSYCLAISKLQYWSIFISQNENTKTRFGLQIKRAYFAKRIISISKVMYVIFLTTLRPAIQLALGKFLYVKAKFYKTNALQKLKVVLYSLILLSHLIWPLMTFLFPNINKYLDGRN